ncbi:MAG: molybdopterin molybdotransferase MoeA [Marinibacterium sp.]
MIPVAEARDRLFDLVDALPAETVDLQDAAGRVLAAPVTARRDQPPFAASAMDGYAVRSAGLVPGATFEVIGTAAAGRGFAGPVGDGEAVRIFTGAPVPEGADAVVIQEDVDRDSDRITISAEPGPGSNIRPAGIDFTAGATMDPPRRLGPPDIALLAAMNAPEIPVHRRPEIALISTGDELVFPGEDPGPDQIVASNTFGLRAMLDAAGARTRILPIARDTESSLVAAFDLARGADLVVTIGGASVGDHDLVGGVAARLGMAQSFYKVAMRPGKPLMAGRLRDAAMVGLPGNPVSALVCARIFLVPMIDKMLGLGAHGPTPRQAILSEDLPANGAREHYMRAVLTDTGITAAPRQDSSLLSVLARANALLIRPPNDGPLSAGARVDYLPF